jgi:hypothetical protein
MRPELRSLDSPDAPGFPNWAPRDAQDFELLFEASIGVADDIGSDTFSFVVCTATSLARHVSRDQARWGHGRLVVAAFDPKEIARSVESLCARSEGSDWPEIVGKLSRYMYWEFDGYRPSPSRR